MSVPLWKNKPVCFQLVSLAGSQPAASGLQTKPSTLFIAAVAEGLNGALLCWVLNSHKKGESVAKELVPTQTWGQAVM